MYKGVNRRFGDGEKAGLSNGLVESTFAVLTKPIKRMDMFKGYICSSGVYEIERALSFREGVC